MPLIDTPVTIFWFRRDLRLSDNHGLCRALTRSSAVLPVFIFDRLILGQLPSKQDRRVSFIHTLVDELNTRLTALGSALYVLHEKPVEAFALLTRQFRVHEVIANHDYEPYAIERDAAVSAFLATRNIALTTYKDQVVFEKDEITKSDGTPYTVFTPYAKAWKRQLSTQGISNYPSEQHLGALARLSSPGVPGLDTLGFEAMSPGPAPL
ncbi:MAG TPA: deoxyribodipyrimidine photo-lyase, partial [Puia sp.]|nr:deoxyribodipyrimidine photo-lyase [Puia sp.]